MFQRLTNHDDDTMIAVFHHTPELEKLDVKLVGRSAGDRCQKWMGRNGEERNV
jgi:hypothetical protein